MEKIIHVITIFYTLGAPLYFGVQDKPGPMFIALLGGVIVLIFLNLGKFKKWRLTPTGLEAELREIADEAYATLDNLKDLAVDLADPIITFITMQNRIIQYIPLDGKIEMVNEISSTLKKFHIDDKKINATRKMFDAALIVDHIKRINQQVEQIEAISGDVKSQILLLSEHKNMYEAVKLRKGEIEHIFEKNTIINNPELHKFIKDLDYYIEEKNIRRPEIWGIEKE